MKFVAFTSMLLLSAAAYGCDNKPTEGKPQAQVGEPIKTTPSAAASGSAAPSSSAAVTPAKGEALAITPTNSKVEFVGAKISGKHEGKFEKFEGTVDLVANKIESSTVKVSIDLSSVKTDQSMLDEHLKKPDFFDVAQFATAKFESTAIKAEKGPKGETHSITGTLDFHGVKRPLTFPATITVSADKLGAKAEFGINRLDFGVKYEGKKDDLIKSDVLIKLDLELPRTKK